MAYGRRSRGQSQVFEDASDRIGRGEEGDQLAPCATEVADEDLDGIGPAEQLGPGQALVATSGQLRVGEALVGEALRSWGALGQARRGLLGTLAARCAWWWRSGDDVISPARGGSEYAVVGEHRSPRPGDERHESLEEGRGLEAEGLSAVGEGFGVAGIRTSVISVKPELLAQLGHDQLTNKYVIGVQLVDDQGLPRITNTDIELSAPLYGGHQPREPALPIRE